LCVALGEIDELLAAIRPNVTAAVDPEHAGCATVGREFAKTAMVAADIQHRQPGQVVRDRDGA
jgi:hypothetical protein